MKLQLNNMRAEVCQTETAGKNKNTGYYSDGVIKVKWLLLINLLI